MVDSLFHLPPILRRKAKKGEWQSPVDYFGNYNHYARAVLLTGQGPEDVSHISIAAFSPAYIYRLEKDGDQYKLSFRESTPGGGEFEQHSIKMESPDKFWSIMNSVQKSMNFSDDGYPYHLCGGIGFLSYEALHLIENLQKKTVDNYSFPLFEWTAYNMYAVFDHQNHEMWEVSFQWQKDLDQQSLIQQGWVDVDPDLYFCRPVPRFDFEAGEDDLQIPQNRDFRVTNLCAENTPGEYREKVKRIQEYIYSGEVYEVNLSQQIKGDFAGNAFGLFQKLFGLNSAPYSAYLNLPFATVLCNSPELYLRAHGDTVETRPIKGTAPRGRTPAEDEQNRQELLSSEKNQAELYMIVDLMRNDLSRCCRPGSVQVRTPKRLEHYSNVHHLVGIVDGLLNEGTGYYELLKATFPGGSITGCPKVRCMEIIEELETFSRHLYTGTIFLMNESSFNGNIVIRNAIIQDSTIYLNAGGAITIDSDPEEEFEETEHKLASWMKVLGVQTDD